MQMTKVYRLMISLVVLCYWMVLGCSSPTSPEPQLNGLWTLHLNESGINCWKLPLSGSGVELIAGNYLLVGAEFIAVQQSGTTT